MTSPAAASDRFELINELLTVRAGPLAWGLMSVVLVVNAVAFAAMVASSDGLVTPYGEIIGGDFIVFDTIAEVDDPATLATLYDRDQFNAMLAERFTERGAFSLMWLYPPTMRALVSPLGALPYSLGFALWVAGGVGLLALAVRALWDRSMAIFAAIAAPATFQAVITGQTGLYSGALLCCAGFFASTRPLLAGVAAGLLTVKPQLGLLLPLAFAAAGCWRAFAAAGATTVALAIVTTFSFGLETWSAFFASLSDQGARLGSDAFPFEKVVSVFGGAVFAGAPHGAALALHGAASLLLAGLTVFIWRTVKASDLRMAALCAAAPLVTPYAMYYELPLMLPAIVVLARRGAVDGWLRGEKIFLAALWIAPMFVLLNQTRPGVPLGFLVVAALLACVLRRLQADGALSLSSGRPASVAA